MIQWNKVTWYSKALAMAVFILLPFITFYFGFGYGYLKKAAEVPVLAGSEPVTPPESTWASFSHEQGGFSVKYPLDLPANEIYGDKNSPDWSLSGGSGVKYFDLEIPKIFDPQTNFAGAKLTVGASSDKTAIAKCSEKGYDGEDVRAAKVGGADFTVISGTSAGAGNYYETTMYRTVRSGKCYSLEYTIHSMNIYNYPEYFRLRAFDRAKVRGLLEEIVRTFRFL